MVLIAVALHWAFGCWGNMILAGRAEPFLLQATGWNETPFLSREMRYAKTSSVVIRYGKTRSGNCGPGWLPTPPPPGGRFPWEMTASVGIGKVGLSEKTSSDQYSCGRSMNNWTVSAVFSFLDPLHSSGLVVLLPRKLAAFKAEEPSGRTSAIFPGQRSTQPYSVCRVVTRGCCVCLRRSEAAWRGCFESSFQRRE